MTKDDVAAVPRLLALDWLRGLVMVLMAVDHVDAVRNPHHAAGDSVWMAPREALRVGDFLTRWATHLCAPTFAFLAGAGMALSVARARARGEPAAAVDRHWCARGLVLVLLDLTLVSLYLRTANEGAIYLQVLFALGGGLVLLVPLRRLRSRWLLLLAAALPIACELLFVPMHWTNTALSVPPGWNGLLVSGGIYAPWSIETMVLYPLLPWLPPLLLGHLFGRLLAAGAGTDRAVRCLLVGGGTALASAFCLRWAAGFGNAQLQRRDGSLVEWLHTSKYPPSITYFGFELGLMAIVLSLLLVLAAARDGRSLRVDPLATIGRVPLFFYLLHLPVIGVLVHGGVVASRAAWPHSWLLALLVAALCWPVCAWYGRYKQRAQGGWTRLL